jgi:hypothetical protein
MSFEDLKTSMVELKNIMFKSLYTWIVADDSSTLFPSFSHLTFHDKSLACLGFIKS